MRVSNEEQKELEQDTDSEVKKIPKERRKRSPFDMVMGATNIGGGGLLIFILHMLTQLGDEQKDLTQWAHQNTLAAQKTQQMLQSMRDEFGGDIRGFEMKHDALKRDVSELRLNQERSSVRMQGMEGNFKQWAGWTEAEDKRAMRAYDDQIKSWADRRFKRATKND